LHIFTKFQKVLILKMFVSWKNKCSFMLGRE
jgi:hypothetical protein